MRLFAAGERVETPDFGPGAVIDDWRVRDVLQASRDTVWVLLDCGENPQPYRPSDLTREALEVAA